MSKVPLFDFADLLIFLGVVLLLAGLYLIDWRLVLIGLGNGLILAGWMRLRNRQQ